jgi:hypothetical protein
MSTRGGGSRAGKGVGADPDAGAVTPRYSPFVTTSKVVAVPKSTTMTAPWRRGGHAVDDAVGADVAGRLVEDRHARAHARLHDEGIVAEVLARERDEHRRQRRHDAGEGHASDLRGIDAGGAEEAAHEDPILVRGLFPAGGEAPVRLELRSQVDAEDRVVFPASMARR